MLIWLGLLINTMVPVVTIVSASLKSTAKRKFGTLLLQGTADQEFVILKCGLRKKYVGDFKPQATSADHYPRQLVFLPTCPVISAQIVGPIS